MIVLDSKSAMCMAKNGKDAKNTRHIARKINIYWCEVGLQLSDIDTKNVGKHDLNPRIKYIMILLEN